TPPPPSTANPGWYDKQYDFSHEPVVSHSGQHTYVVSQPDPSSTHYHVPSGAYPTSAPYTNDAPAADGMQFSSAGNGFAHPVTAMQHGGFSAAVRFSSAPGRKSDGGLGKEGTGELADRNDSSGAAEYSKLGLDKAWKARK
ncbi:hypothetical protein BDZ89DRAFT_941940, partial [Hymenopellis radicata]